MASIMFAKNAILAGENEIVVAGGMENISNLHDVLTEKKVSFHISDWHLSDDENYTAAGKAIVARRKSMIFSVDLSLKRDNA